MSNRKRPVEGTATASPLEEGLQEVETKTRRVERIPSAPPPAPPSNQPEDEDDETVVETDEIMALVQEYGDFNDCTIRVERLPDYQRDGLVGVRANREFCGVIPLHPNYESAIQRSFGGGSYLLTVRDGGNQLLCRVPRHFRALPELAPPSAAAPPAVPQPAQPQQQALAPRPVINEVADELASLKKIDAMLRSIRGEDQERKPAFELDPDTMLARFMVQNPQLFKDKIGTLLQPGGTVEPAPWYVGVIERFSPTLMELGQLLVYSLAQRQQPQVFPQPAAVANPAPQIPQTLPPGIQPMPVQGLQPMQQPIALPIPEGPVIPNLEELKTFLAEALFSNADVEPVADEILKFLRFKSWYAPLLNRYFDEPVENLAAMLLQEFEQIPDYSQNWLQNLQDAVNARRKPS